MNYRLKLAAEAKTPEEGMVYAMASPLVHFAGFVTIEDVDKKRIRPVPNILQERIADAYEWCLANDVAPRIMVLKPRKKGASTFCGHVCYHHARRFPSNGMMMGDETSRSETIWKIFTDYAKVDTFPWDSRVTKSNTEKFVMRYKDGSEGLWNYDTANDPKAGIGGTRHVMWFTEAARYAKTGSRMDSNAINSALESMGRGKLTLAFAESTPEGVNGWFYEHWLRAAWLRDAKKGKFGNGWIKVFAAWHEFDDCTCSKDDPTKAHYFGGELSPREKRGVELYKWTEEQIAWRRMKIDEFNGDENVMDEQHPEDDVSCFLASGRVKFHQEGMARLEKLARSFKGEIGRLERVGPGRVAFFPDTEGWVWVSERPKQGCAYVGFMDCASGEQSVGAKNPDSHACGILRTPYSEVGSVGAVEHNTALAAAIHTRDGCRWDADLVAKRMAMLADWYGGCMVVPEMNGPGQAIVLKLREHGARIYMREKQDANVPGKTLAVAGWETNTKTRDIAVEALATVIREQTLDVAYTPAVGEMRTFVENDRGKAEARPGAHDDWVMGLGIGMACIRFASVYREHAIAVRGNYQYGGSRKSLKSSAYT